MKSFGGDIVGVVDRESTNIEGYQKLNHNEIFFLIVHIDIGVLTIRCRWIQFLFETSQERSWKRTTAFPNVKKFDDPSLLRRDIRELDLHKIQGENL